MNTLNYLQRHVSHVHKIGYGQFSATVKIYNKPITVTFTDSEVYDRIFFDNADNGIPPHHKGTGGYTLRQALSYIYNLATERRK